MFKKRLFTPGPTPIPHSVNLAMITEMIHHRHPEFIKLFKSIRESLKYLFQTKQEVCIIAGSGTVSLEAIVSNFTNKSKVLVINAGKFGLRWKELNIIYNNDVVSLDLEWGKSVTSEMVLKILKNDLTITHVFLTHSETSTGAAIDIMEISEKIKKFNSDILICVDGITAIGAMKFKFDEWNIDVACTGSQKGLMLPPGLSFVVASELAWQSYQNHSAYYFDLRLIYDSAQKNSTPFTPAISMLQGLKESLSIIQTETIESIWERHLQLANSVRSAVDHLGLELFANNPSNALTAIRVPDKIDGLELVKRFKLLAGMTVAGGQDTLKSKIFRISHLGYYDEFDMISVIAGLEKVLHSFSYKFNIGTGVKAAMDSLWHGNKED